MYDGVPMLQGEVLGITRFGLAKMKESVLMLASVSIIISCMQPTQLFIATKYLYLLICIISLRRRQIIYSMLHSTGKEMQSPVRH